MTIIKTFIAKHVVSVFMALLVINIFLTSGYSPSHPQYLQSVVSQVLGLSLGLIVTILFFKFILNLELNLNNINSRIMPFLINVLFFSLLFKMFRFFFFT